MPAYNEESRIGESLGKIKTYLEGGDFDFEIIVVDDGSRDGTSRIVTDAASADSRIRLLRNESNKGKGYSVRRGVLESAGDLVLFSDADLSTPIDELDGLLRSVGDFDIVIASRSLPDSQVVIHQPFYREFMGKIFNLFVQMMLVRGIIDTQCGFKLMTRKAADTVFRSARIDSFSFDVEMILIARRCGLGVKDMPVRWIDSRASKVHPVRDSAHMLLDLFRIKLYDILGLYKRQVERE
ncbi:MAG: dolichyl-phosphate beta-glucosyltransferase [Candidatus Eisenbacteria bacterium]